MGKKKNLLSRRCCGIKGIQVKIKSCTSQLREFSCPKASPQKEKSDYPKQNNVKSYTCLMKAYRHTIVAMQQNGSNGSNDAPDSIQKRRKRPESRGASFLNKARL